MEEKKLEQNFKSIGATLEDLTNIALLAEEASPFKEKNLITYKKTLSECRKEFTNLLVEGFANGGQNGIDDKKFLKSIFKLIFKNTYFYKEKESDLEENKNKTPIEAITEEFLLLALALNYLKDDSLNNVLKKYNVKLEMPKLEDLRPYFDNDGIRDTLFSYLESAKKTQDAIIANNNIIESEVFNKLPIHLKYDRDTNPKGLKASKFNDLLKFEVISKIDKNEAEEQYEKMSKKIFDKSCADHLAQMAAMSMIDTKNKAEEKKEKSE